MNGPIGAPGQMRMDVGFPGQPGPGIYIYLLIVTMAIHSHLPTYNSVPQWVTDTHS